MPPGQTCLRSSIHGKQKWADTTGCCHLIEFAVLQSLSDYKEDAKPLFFSLIVPEDVYPVVHNIPGIKKSPTEDEISKKVEKLRGSAEENELRARNLRLPLRVQYRILKVPFVSAIEDEVANLHI